MAKDIKGFVDKFIFNSLLYENCACAYNQRECGQAQKKTVEDVRKPFYVWIQHIGEIDTLNRTGITYYLVVAPRP